MNTNCCARCSFKSLNMNEFKKHTIDEHDKGEHDWWSEEIKAEYYHNQCDSEFNNRDIFSDHVDTAHSDDSDIIKLEIIESSEQGK